jgi:hypothetical protein
MMTTKYQQFLNDNRGRIKEEFSEPSNSERFVKLVEEWKKHKATLEEQANTGNTAKTANTGNSKYATEFYIARLVLTYGMFYI